MECSWRNDDGMWKSECGLSWSMTNNDGLIKNEMNFCPKCGLKISEMYPDKDVQDGCKGGMHRNSDGWFVVCACDCCGKVGSTERADELNNREKDRNRGFQFDRIPFNIVEQACHEVWADENRPRPGINGTISIVQSMVSRSIRQENFLLGFSLRNKPLPREEITTDRDYKLAATVIQYLGTNGGRYLLDEIDKRVEEL